MKVLILAATVFAISAPSMAADVGVSINIGQPGFYGQIDIGNAPRPALVYAEPIIVQREPRYVAQPIYLRVPPGHMKHWSKHCREYNACGQQVYFVQDSWYNDVYAPHYRSEHEGYDRGRQDEGDRHDHGDHEDHDKHRGRGHERD